MELLDLPPELYERIITYLVKDAPVEKLWKLRITCRNFHSEILRQALTILSPEAFQSPIASRILNKNLGRYLAIRVPTADNISPNLPSDVRENLPKKIAQMAEYLYKQLNADTKGKRWEALLLLCKGLGATMLPHSPSSEWPDLRTYLWGDDPVPSCINRKFGIEDQLIACVAIGNVERATRLLPNASIEDDALVYGKLLTNAVVLADKKLLVALIGYVRHHRWLSRASRQSIVLGNSHLGVKSPIHKAIEHQKVTFLRILLDYLHTHVTHPGAGMFDDFVSRALRIDAVECLAAILDWSQRSRLSIKHESNDLFRRACRLEASNSISLLIQRGFVSLESGTASRSPMFMAIRTDCGPNVKAVIDAGADINLRVDTGPKNGLVMPLEYAVYSKKFNVVKVLIKAGAVLPPLSAWPVHYKTYKRLRKALYAREEIGAPDFEYFKSLSKVDRAAL